MSQSDKSDHEGGRQPNRLINEQSPYLRQHAYNPVDWYPWGEEASGRARAENKPILLSIGYSACHWCHVMERESFENETIAAAMNENFVSIKVDREERPDLDQIYMDAVQLMSGRGGWPLTMFLTPDGKPFYGGTYFPPQDRHGLPGFPRVLAAVAEAWKAQSQEVKTSIDQIAGAIGKLSEFSPADGGLKAELAASAARALAESYDSVHGGLGAAPKFPNTFVFSLFLRVYDADHDAHMAEMVRHTLTQMAKGGIFDQIGGGFHRYSVDAEWLVPHFEKMLYDNALLARLYLDAGRSLNEPGFIDTGGQILEYVLREMASLKGGFYSSQDADSEGEEGKFFLWTAAEVREALGEHLTEIASRYFDVTEEGNFEGKNILHRTMDVGVAGRLFSMSEEAMAAMVKSIAKRLFEAREQRVKPGRDEKILTAWNGMMISTFAEGYRVLGARRFLTAAERAAEFVMSQLWDGKALKRSCTDGVARFNAYLEDYALMANAFIDLYEASLDQRHLEHARVLADVMLERFLDREKGGFFFTSDDHEQLITRSKAAFDGSTPSGNSAAVMALLRLAAYTGEQRYMSEAERALKLFGELIVKQPFAFSHMLEAVDLYQRGPTEIVLVGKRNAPETREWLERIGLLYLPNRALFVVEPKPHPGRYLPEQARGKKQVDGRLTAYVCRERVCSAPVTSFEELAKELGSQP